MALYYFTLKGDKRPGKFGSHVKAVEHVDYIDREGKYKNIDAKNPKSLDNIITTTTGKDVLDGSTLLLYDSPYGSITNTDKGLALADDPSPDTLAIAMMVAQERIPGPLVLEGSDLFRAKCIQAALLADLPVSFADEDLQAVFIQKKEEWKHEREEYRRKGGRIIRARSIPESDAPILRHPHGDASSEETLSRVRHLSELHVVRPEQQPERMVQHDEERRVGFDEPAGYSSVRRGLSRARRERARVTARKILQNIEANQDTLLASLKHVEYINREKAFKKKGGCIYTQHRLPKWAKDSPNVFFRAADRYSKKNITRYKEMVFALQNELTLEQNLEIVNRFIKEVLPNTYYTLAVHDKVGAMAQDGTHNLHVHLMISPHIIDDVEQEKERLRSDYFSYPLRKNAKDQSDKAKRTHGAPIDRRWSLKGIVPELRATYEDITNDVLRKYGFRVQIDHRSLKAQEQEALQNGDLLLAKILHRIPERHVGNIQVMQEKNPMVDMIKKYRVERKEYLDLLFKADMLEHSMAEAEQEKQAKALQEDVASMVQSAEFQESDVSATSKIGILRQNFLEAIHSYEHYQKMMTPSEKALKDARLEYMTAEEREVYLKYLHLKEEQEHWTTFQENLKKPDTDDTDAQAAYQELIPALKAKQEQLDHDLLGIKEKIEAIDLRLKNPDIEKQIQLLTHQVLQENKAVEPLLHEAEATLKQAMDDLTRALHQDVTEENSQDLYTIADLLRIFRRRQNMQQRSVNRLKKQLGPLLKKVMSMERATRIAQDVYSKNECKTIRQGLYGIKKKEATMAAEEEKYQRLLQDAMAKKPLPSGMTLASIKEHLASLAKWKKDAAAEKARLEKQQAHWQDLFKRPNIEAKIKAIALGILHKNGPYQEKYEALRKEYQEATSTLSHTKTQIDALEEQAKKEGKNARVYRALTEEEAAWLKEHPHAPDIPKTESKENTEPAKETKPSPLLDGMHPIEDILEVLYRRQSRLKAQVRRLQKNAYTLKKDVISEERALLIAQDVYSKGECKTIRQGLRKVAKKEAAMAEVEKKYQAVLQDAKQTPEAIQTAKEKLASLATAKQELTAEKTKLETRQTYWQEQFKKPERQESLKDIASGILRKNAPKLQLFQAAEQAHQTTKNSLTLVQQQIASFSKQAEKDGLQKQISFSLTKEEIDGLMKHQRPGSREVAQKPKTAGRASIPADAPSKIADAIAGNEACAKLVAVLRDDDQGLKNWSLMTEAAKEEEFNKSFYSQL